MLGSRLCLSAAALGTAVCSSTTTTTNYWKSDFPRECLIEACKIRVRGIKAENDAFCQDECSRIGSGGMPNFCPEAAFGEEYLMKCMVEEYYPSVCKDSMSADVRVCNFKEDCVLKACKNRLQGQSELQTNACQNMCDSLLYAPRLCDMNGKGDDALAACVVERGNNCFDILGGTGPMCVPKV